MKQEIQTKIRPIEEEIVQVNIKNLNERYDNQKTKLGEALNTIDQTILDCGELIETTKNIHMELSGLNEKFSRLGASPLSARRVKPSKNLTLAGFVASLQNLTEVVSHLSFHVLLLAL